VTGGPFEGYRTVIHPQLSFCEEYKRMERKKNAALGVNEIAKRLGVGRLRVYAMLEAGVIPGIRFGRNWIVTRHAYGEWERTCGLKASLAGG